MKRVNKQDDLANPRPYNHLYPPLDVSFLFSFLFTLSLCQIRTQTKRFSAVKFPPRKPGSRAKEKDGGAGDDPFLMGKRR